MKWSVNFGWCLSLLMQANSLQAQLITTGNSSVSANDLVSNLIGQGIAFSNASFTGRAVAIGTFNGISSNIGLNSGVIITSGHINVAPGPNNNGGATFSNNGPNIPELETLAQSITYDGAILEFDFVPQSNFISFRYVFASEEYNEYVCSEFNDAFAFYITGPGITGAENLALVPSTTIPVTINTINNGLVGALGSTANDPCILGNSAFFVGNTQQTVQYDGFTTVLTAQRSVIPCQTYHIRLMIADGADDIFDSAVFLEENSFNAATYSISVTTPLNDSTIYEGCTTATVTFSRPQADPAPLTINFITEGSAIAGTDYAALPGSVIIPAGQTSASFVINANADGLNEGTETIIIRGVTSCGDIPATILLKDKPQLYIHVPPQSICDGNGPVTLVASVSGGMQPYTFLWDNGSVNASISVNPGVTTSYQVQVSDFCGATEVYSTEVRIAPVPTASINSPPFVCSGIPVTVTYTGTATPAATYLWNFDNPSSVSSGSSQGPYQITWDSSGLKHIRVQVIENGCSSMVVSAQTLVNPTPTASFAVEPIVCAGQNTVVTYTGTGTDMGGYGWGFPGGVIITGGRRGPFEIRWDSAGVYGISLTVTENGCSSPGNQQFVNVRPTPASGFTAESPVCIGEQSTIVYAGSGSSGATFNWSFAGGNILSGAGQGPYEIAWNSAGTKNVFLSVTENGCTGRITNIPVVVNPNPTGNFTVAGPVCEGQPTTVTYTGTAGSGALFQWNFDGAVVLSGSQQGPYSVMWTQAGNYGLSLVVNDNGCASAAYQSNVIVHPTPLAEFSATGPVCTGEASVITYLGSLGNHASFTWDFGGGQIISGSGPGPLQVYWSTPGNRQITLMVTSDEGCPSLPQSKPVWVKPTPTAIFTAETPVCINEPSTLIFTGTANPNATYTWMLSGGQIVDGSGQGPLEVAWSTAGIKTLTLSVSENGCSSQPFTQQVRIKPLPTGFFTATSPVCAGGTVSVMYSGNAAPNAIYQWDFSQGSVVSGSGPGPYQIRWDQEGPKPISLSVIEDGCASLSEIRVIQVNPVPGNEFTVEGPLCLNEQSTIVYLGNAFPNARFIWEFDGGTVHSGENGGPFQVSWSGSGQKRIRLQIEQSGCPSIPSYRDVMVYPIPESPFQASYSLCTNQEADVLYSGVTNASAIYHWNFNGATIISGSGPGPFKLVWNTSGEKQISLRVEENGCHSATTEFTARVHDYPVADFQADPLTCQGAETEVRFTGVADEAAVFSWDFDGAEILSGSGPGPYKLRWNTTGNKGITLLVSQFGCAAAPSNTQLFVAPAPIASAGDDQLVCSGDSVSLGGTSSNGYSYLWIPSSGLDRPTAADPRLTIRNNRTDTLVVHYVVATTLGNCTVYDTVQVAVKPEPAIRFERPAGQCFQDHAFRFEITGEDLHTAQFFWDFGPFANDRYSNLEDPVNIRYSASGVHPFRLRYTINGCSGMDVIDSVNIFAMPEAIFSGQSVEGCPPLTAELRNHSVFGQGYQYVWDMGDGQIVNEYQPQHVYTAEGRYSVTLTVFNAFGCKSDFTMHSLVRVFPVPQAGFMINPEILSTEHPLANIIDQSSGAISWRYTTGTGSVVTQPQFSWLYPNPGVYQVTQEVTNEWGCKDSTFKKLEVKPLMTFFIPNAFTPNNDGENDYFRCYGLNIEEFSMQIFNRWGQLVFYSENIDEGWDGRMLNEDGKVVSQMDVYAVLVYVKDSPDLPARRIDHRVTLVK
jgi:gliding motility-associated-like protein